MISFQAYKVKWGGSPFSVLLASLIQLGSVPAEENQTQPPYCHQALAALLGETS